MWETENAASISQGDARHRLRQQDWRGVSKGVDLVNGTHDSLWPLQ
jgi:hypothetical protein